MTRLDEYLSFAEYGSLEAIRDGLKKPVVPTHHKQRLLELGYIAEADGGLAVTDAGRMRLALGK
jgi:hypothetical protein